ncbi:MAG: HD domain-containing protein, partial [Verrucomicrobiota bacterium]
MHPLLQEIEQGASLPPAEEWSQRFGGEFTDLPERMAATPQDPEWHGEGDVLVHTNWVLRELEKLISPGGEASGLAPRKKVALALAAFVHDVGKIWTTREQERAGRIRIVATGHPARGRSWFAQRHHSLGLDPWMREAVFGLIGHHHDPRQWVRKGADWRAYRKLARHCPLDLVTWLELADVRGREAPDLQDEEVTLALFRDQVEDFGLWGRDDPWEDWREELDSLSREESPRWRLLLAEEAIRQAELGTIFSPQEALAKSYSWKEGLEGEVILLCGLSG